MIEVFDSPNENLGSLPINSSLNSELLRTSEILFESESALIVVGKVNRAKSITLRSTDKFINSIELLEMSIND